MIMMACRNAVEIITDSEIEAKRPLHVERLQPGDGQAMYVVTQSMTSLRGWRSLTGANVRDQ
jgi:hypothetical protein